MVKRPSHCQRCSHWEAECKHISDPSMIYSEECGRCSDKSKTCWMAILPDGWTFNRISSRRAEGEENPLLCSDCVSKYYDVFFDEQGYDVLEGVKW